MQDNKSKNNIMWVALVILVVAIVLAVIFFLPKQDSSKYENLDEFASCLTEKGAVMYGAYWCSHCQAQKEEFGSSFKNINYVECTEKPDQCTAAGVQGYPTWVIASTTLVGEQTLETLAVHTNCALQKNN